MIAVTANVIALLLWFRMHQALAWKLTVGGGETLAAVFIIGLYVGERRMHVKVNRRIAEAPGAPALQGESEGVAVARRRAA